MRWIGEAVQHLLVWAVIVGFVGGMVWAATMFSLELVR